MKILKQGGKYFFDSKDVPNIPLKIFERKQDDDWEAIVESNLNQRLDSDSGPLISCTYLISNPPQTLNELIFTCHHSIVDAAAMLTLFHDTLSFCITQAEGQPMEDTTELPLLPPEEKFFPSTYRGLSGRLRINRFMLRQIGDEISYRIKTRSKHRAPLHLTGSNRILPLKLSSQLSKRIINASRKKRVTLNSLFTASLLTAVGKHVYKETEIPLRYFTFADLRPYLKPPVREMNLGSYHSPVRFTIPVNSNQNIWDLAHRINEQVREGFHRGDKYISALLTPQMMKMIIRSKSMRMGTVALSYPGTIELPTSYGKIQILGTRGYISNFPLGPEYTAALRYYNKEFWWDILYLDSDMDHTEASHIAEEIQTSLSDAAEI